jgi:hypothetical protein
MRANLIRLKRERHCSHSLPSSNPSYVRAQGSFLLDLPIGTNRCDYYVFSWTSEIGWCVHMWERGKNKLFIEYIPRNRRYTSAFCAALWRHGFFFLPWIWRCGGESESGSTSWAELTTHSSHILLYSKHTLAIACDAYHELARSWMHEYEYICAAIYV